MARITQPCGARSRQDTHPCKRQALANVRCPNLGGMSTGPKTPEAAPDISGPKSLLAEDQDGAGGSPALEIRRANPILPPRIINHIL